MNWSKLPKRYKDLEKNFNNECWRNSSKYLTGRFRWNETPQGYEFWEACYSAKNVSELPPITITDYPKQ